MAAPEQVSAAVFVQWIEDGYQLRDHIQNGVCRGLYGQALADEAIRRISTLDAEFNRVFLTKGAVK